MNAIPKQLPDLDKETEKDINLCREIMNISGYAHQTLRSRLHILQEYIPPKFSPRFRNPCWYDYHHIPNSSLLQPKDGCSLTPLVYNPSKAHQVLKYTKISGTRKLRCLPAFFLSGFHKCGTSTMYHTLLKHPLVATPTCKESQFWTQFLEEQGRDIDKKMQSLWYFNFFSPSLQTIESNPLSMTFDGSCRYLVWNTASDFCVLPKLLMRVLPEAKFIVMMRNPSKRVFSHYFYFSVKKFSEKVPKTFGNITKYVHSQKALKVFHHNTVDAIAKFQSCVNSGHAIHHCVRNKSIDHQTTLKYYRNGCVGLQYSMYYYHIVPWLSFIPRERFLFLRTEDLATNSSLTMSDVWHFLNLDELPATIEVFNINKKGKFPPQTKKLLDDFFQPYNQLLAHLLQDTRFLWND